MLAMRWSLLRNHHCLKIFRTSNMEGPSSSTTFEGGQTGPGAGGEGGVSFAFLLGREKTGGESCQDNIEMMEVRKQEAVERHLGFTATTLIYSFPHPLFFSMHTLLN